MTGRLGAEIRPATIALDEGEIVGHRILDYELSRQVVGTGNRGHASDVSSAQASNAHRCCPHVDPLAVVLLSACFPLALLLLARDRGRGVTRGVQQVAMAVKCGPCVQRRARRG